MATAPAAVAAAPAPQPAAAVKAEGAGETATPPLPKLPGGVNPLDFLYKLATQRGLQSPDFKQVTEQGPAHMKTFVWHCSFNSMVAQGTGRSKKEAKIAAAKAIRDNLDYASLPAPVAGGGGFHTNALKRKNGAAAAGGGAGAGNPALNGSKKRRGPTPLAYAKPFGGPGGGPGFGQGFGPPGPFTPFFGFGPGPMGPPMGGPPMGGPPMGGPPMGMPHPMGGPMGGPPMGGPFRGFGPMGPPSFLGPQPIDPQGKDPYNNDKEGAEDETGEEVKKEGEGEEAKEGNEEEGEGEDGEKKKKSYGPSRDEFMSPSYGGFFNDMAALPYDPNSGASLEEWTQPYDRERSMILAEYQARMAGGPRSRLSKLDRQVIRKHREIFPKEEDIAHILKLVTETEETLKKVAEAINTDDLKKVTGMTRVGDLSKGLLLATDRCVDLVLLCKARPSKPLLSEVVKQVREKLKEVVGEECKYQVVEKQKESGFIVTANTEQLTPPPPPEPEKEGEEGEKEEGEKKAEAPEKPAAAAPAAKKANEKYTVRVTLTSTSLTAEKKEGEGEVAVEEKVTQPLALGKCMKALAEMRHSKWFQVTAVNLPSCVECIRVVKDLCQRDPAWSSLSNWAVELLVERALFSAWMPLNPAASLMRVLEVVSSGIFMSDGPGLRDPCEKEAVNVTAGMMGKQKREDITRSAQAYLRCMHFRQIYKVLGLSREEAEEYEYKPENNSHNGKQQQGTAAAAAAPAGDAATKA